MAVALAKTVGDRHQVSKALGQLSTSYRLGGDNSLALSILDDCEASAEGCPCCLGDVDRRRGIAALISSDITQSVTLFDRAIAHLKQVPNSDGAARVKVVRGVSFFHQGEIDAALRDENEALEELSMESPMAFHAAAVVNVAGILALGSPKHFAHATDYLNSFRQRLRGIPDLTFIRIKIRWIEGLILARRGEINRAIRKLDNVRRALVKLHLEPDVVAVSADLATLYHEKSDFNTISILADSCLRAIDSQSEAVAALRSLAEAATEHIAAVPSAVAALRFSVRSSMPSLLGPATAPGPLISGSDT